MIPEIFACFSHVDILRKQLSEIRLFLQINLQEVLESLSYFSYRSGFAHLARTTYQQWFATRVFFPFAEFLVNMSLEICHILCNLGTKIQIIPKIRIEN